VQAAGAVHDRDHFLRVPAPVHVALHPVGLPADVPYAPAPVYQPQTQLSVAPSIQREVCYTGGCYHLQGDGVTVAYAWIWVPTAPPPPPAPPAPPGR
jgi:hypothetical protein